MSNSPGQNKSTSLKPHRRCTWWFTPINSRTAWTREKDPISKIPHEGQRMVPCVKWQPEIKPWNPPCDPFSRNKIFKKSSFFFFLNKTAWDPALALSTPLGQLWLMQPSVLIGVSFCKEWRSNSPPQLIKEQRVSDCTLFGPQQDI